MNALKQNLFKAIDFLIRVESGPDAGKAYRLQPPKIIVGRDPRCQVTLTDPKTSRKQIQITFYNNVYCEDISSRKNTLVNGKPCGKTVLKPGDKISFGQTTLEFITRANEKAQPQLSGAQAPPTDEELEKKQGAKRFRMFMVGILVLAGLLFILEEPATPPPEEKLATVSDLEKQIEETEERMSLMRDDEEKNRTIPATNDKYLFNVEKHFISGFRDFQNGRYGRALDSFGTTIATEHNNVRALIY